MGYADGYERARRMQSFYEPAYYGRAGQGYGSPYGLAAATPTTIGGFSPGPLPQPGELADPAEEERIRQLEMSGSSQVRDLATQVRTQHGAKPELVKSMRVRQAFDGPPMGVANMQNYGVGQLQNYGVGALKPYQPLQREEDLRWRTR